MSEIVWSLGAEVDVQTTYERLERFDGGAGDRFYEDVLKTTALLGRYPQLGKMLSGHDTRRLLLSNRNYAIYYMVEARGVIIHAVLDLRAHPLVLKHRVAGLP